MLLTHFKEKKLKTTNPRILQPVAQRSLQSVRFQVSRGAAAFYLGSGVDRQLANDARRPGTAPTWPELVAMMKPFPHATKKEISDYAEHWPTETALVARLRLGEDAFKTKISERTDVEFVPDLKKPFTRILSELLLRTNLIVTPNYSSHISKTLRAFVAARKPEPEPEIIVLTREDLPSFQFPTADPNPRRIYLIHIHGRCVERSNLIFDAWGYNIAVNDDPHYHSFLYDLFSYRSVIAVGTSWSDIPIRNQAALVFRTQNYQRPSHISLDFAANKKTLARNARANSARREWSNAMQAAYGIRMIPVGESEQVSVLDRLRRPEAELHTRPAIDNISSIADFLDYCGDYESPLQQQWLFEVSPSHHPSPSVRICSSVEKLYRMLIKRIRNDNSSWADVARVEQHLRHFHYLYVGPTNKDRPNLWHELSRALTPRTWSHADKRLRFSFLVGQYELDIQPQSNLAGYRIDDSLYDRRLKLSQRLWLNLKSDELTNTALELLTLGWESMSAKLFLDAAAKIARDEAPQYYDPAISRKILRLTARGGEVARATGFFRREAKADVLAAMWLPNPQESRIRILSKIRAAEFFPTGKQKSGHRNNSLIEPAMMAGLTAGLLASHVRSLDLYARSEGELVNQLRTSFTPLLSEAGIKWKEVPRALLAYWEPMIERRLRVPFAKAIRGDFA